MVRIDRGDTRRRCGRDVARRWGAGRQGHGADRGDRRGRGELGTGRAPLPRGRRCGNGRYVVTITKTISSTSAPTSRCLARPGQRLRVTDAPAVRLEAEIAAMNAELPPLSFVLPGGTPAAAQAHVARIVAAPRGAMRRAAARRRREPGRAAAAEPRLRPHLCVVAGVERARRR